MWIIYYLDSGRWWTDRETYTTCGSHIIETRVNDEQKGRHIVHVDHIDGSRLGNHMFIVASFYGLANNSNCVPVINKNIDLPFPRIKNKVTFRMVPASQNTPTTTTTPPPPLQIIWKHFCRIPKWWLLFQWILNAVTGFTRLSVLLCCCGCHCGCWLQLLFCFVVFVWESLSDSDIANTKMMVMYYFRELQVLFQFTKRYYAIIIK